MDKKVMPPKKAKAAKKPSAKKSPKLEDIDVEDLEILDVPKAGKLELPAAKKPSGGKKIIEEESSDEEIVKPKKAKGKKVVEESSDEEVKKPTKNKKAVKAKKIVDDESSSDEEVKKPAAKAKKNVKAKKVSDDESSSEEIVKKPAAKAKKNVKAKKVSDDESSSEEVVKKPRKNVKAKKVVDDESSSDEEIVKKSAVKTKKNVKKVVVDESSSDEEIVKKPRKAKKPVKKDSDDESSSDDPPAPPKRVKKAVPVKAASPPRKVVATKKAPSPVKKPSPPKKAVKKAQGIPVNKVALENFPGAVVVDSYSAQLNQTDLNANNNKFYTIQVLKHGSSFISFASWGRVGAKGQKSAQTFTNLDDAVRDFKKKFYDKTKNHWDVKPFVFKKGNYDSIELEQNFLVEDEDDEDDNKAPKKKLNLQKQVQELVELITNKKTFSQGYALLNIDEKKLPLGKVSDSQIDKGLEVLKEITTELRKAKPDENTLIDLSSRYWTIIPTAGGMRKLPVIDKETGSKNPGETSVEEQSAILEDLRKMVISLKIIKQNNDIDDYYLSLKTDITLLNTSSPEFDQISRYVMNTKGATHHFNLKILNIFKLDKDKILDNLDKNKTFEKTGNHQLLFHGTRTPNLLGIFAEGMRVPKPLDVVNGSMFGRCLYFSPVSSKSFNYTSITFGAPKGTKGFMIVAEVAMGNEKIVYAAESTPLPAGYDSRHAIGQTINDPSGTENWVVDSNVKVPMGKLIKNPKISPIGYYPLIYDECMIYDASQYRFRYLLELESY